MSRKVISSVAALSIGLFSTAAMSAVLSERSVINIIQFDFENPEYVENSSNSTFSHQYGSTADVQGYGDASTGKVGTRVIGSEGSFSQSIVSIFDTLTFNTGTTGPVEVSFNLSYDGSLSSSSEFEHPRSESTVRIFDITGITNWLETDGLLNTTSAVDASELLTFERLSFDLNDVPHNGSVYEFDSSVMGTFLADSAREYGIQITSSSYAKANSSADFLGTSTFEFTNLNGATFESGSGAFLTQQVTTVPVPAAVWLLATGLIGFVGARKSVKASA